MTAHDTADGETVERTEERDRDLDVARMQLREAIDAIDDGDYLDVLDALGSVTGWVAEASKQDEPVATLRVERAGSADDTAVDVHAGETETIDVHGKVTLHLDGEDVGLHGTVADGDA